MTKKESPNGSTIGISRYTIKKEVSKTREDKELEKNLNLYVLGRFYRTPYDENRDFYEQFYERLKEADGLLALEA